MTGRDRWITPAVLPPASQYCRRLFIPGDVTWLMIVSGALDELRFADSFEQVTGITPQQAADAFQAMIDTFNEGDFCMIGAIVAYITTNPPLGTLPCDGATSLRVDYPALYAALPAVFIVDADHFVTPDLRGRTIVGVGAGSGLTPRSIGDVFGEENHTLTIGELAAHTHVDTGHSHAESAAAPTAILIGAGAPAPSALPAASVTGAGSANLTNSGGGGAHNNIQPSTAINYAVIAQ